MRKCLSLLIVTAALAIGVSAAADVESTASPAIASTDTATIEQGVSAGEQKALEALLPADGFYGNLKLQQPVKFYDSLNLYEYIDGQAEGFIAYRFQALASATYKDGDNSVVVDIYDMEKPLQAFGLYSTFRAPSNDFLPIGAQGFRSTEGVMFYKGRMVVKVSADYSDEAEMAKAAQAAGEATAGRIADERKGMEMLDLLPKGGKVANSEKYYLHAVLGQSFLSNGIVAEYKTASGATRMFVCDFGDTQGAATAYDNYLKFATAHGQVTETEKSREFSGEVKYYGQTTVFVKGRFLGGNVGAAKDTKALVDALKTSLDGAAAKQ